MSWFKEMSIDEKAGAYDRNKAKYNFIFRIVVIGLIVVCAFICLGLWGCPQYNVWHAEMDGKAALAQAEQDRQVAVAEAQANLEAEQLNAQAEVARAQGAADARQVEGLGMTAEQYIQYLWVKKLSLADTSVIYLPTTNGIVNLTQDIAGE